MSRWRDLAIPPEVENLEQLANIINSDNWNHLNYSKGKLKYSLVTTTDDSLVVTIIDTAFASKFLRRGQFFLHNSKLCIPSGGFCEKLLSLLAILKKHVSVKIFITFFS